MKLWPIAMALFGVAAPGAVAGRAQQAPAPRTMRLASLGPDLSDTSPGSLLAAHQVALFERLMARAASYRGRVVVTRRSAKEGAAARATTSEWDSRWQRDGKGALVRGLAFGKMTTVVGDGPNAVAAVQEFAVADDGTEQRRLDATRNVWSREKRPEGAQDESAHMVALVTGHFRMLRALGHRFEVSRGEPGGEAGAKAGTMAVRDTDGRFEMVFEAATHHLRSLHLTQTAGETYDLLWDHCELDPRIPETEFTWKPPAAAREVAPRENTARFEF